MVIDEALRQKALDAAVDAHHLAVGIPPSVIEKSTRQVVGEVLRPAVYAAIAVIAGEAE